MYGSRIECVVGSALVFVFVIGLADGLCLFILDRMQTDDAARRSFPVVPPLDDQFSVTQTMIIGPTAAIPDRAQAIFNISGLSYGAMSRPAVEVLSWGRAKASRDR